MTLQQFKKLNKIELDFKWKEVEHENYPNYESFCWHQWQESGDCTYSEIQEA